MENNQQENKKLTKKQKILIASIAGAIILILLLLFGIRGGIKAGKENAKKNEAPFRMSRFSANGA